jgi:hypothetical protein
VVTQYSTSFRIHSAFLASYFLYARSQVKVAIG